MTQRHNMVSLFVLLLLLQSRASAEDYARPRATTYERPQIDLHSTLSLDFGSYRYFEADNNAWLGEVTMRRLPEGSINYQLAGFHRFAVRQVRSQYRRFVRRAARRGWYVRPENDDSTPLFNNRAERDYIGGFNNGAWWQRSWMDSLPSEKGGAPTTPETITIGSDTAWKFGPITFTNQFNVRFDYVAFFELNPNPVETQGDKPERVATLDISAPSNTRPTTNVSFDVKPRVRVGMPRGGDWQSLLRELSVRGSMNIRHRGVSVIQGEVELSWDPDDGVEVTFELALVNW